MIPDAITKALLAVMNSEKANALSLSKGGWEGWLQCELWAALTIDHSITVEREVTYPNTKARCDLVMTPPKPGQPCWIELKAYGIFRQGDEDAFLDAIAADVQKLQKKPGGTQGLSLVVVPNGIATAFNVALQQRKWTGFTQVNAKYVTLYYMSL